MVWTPIVIEKSPEMASRDERIADIKRIAGELGAGGDFIDELARRLVKEGYHRGRCLPSPPTSR